MLNILKISSRNLFRYSRRTLLTVSLVVIGVLFVSVFVSVTGSFKAMMVSQITDSMTGHIQVHRKGYMGAIETLPLHMNMKPMMVNKYEELASEFDEIEAVSYRIKFGGMFSTFSETSNMRLNGIDPEKEFKVTPLLPARISEGSKELLPGQIIVPELFAKSLKVKVGDTVVVIATNQDGSVNGKQLKVSGVVESATGPGGRDGYVHIKDAIEILRMDEPQISEIAIRLKDFNNLHAFEKKFQEKVGGFVNPMGKEPFHVHSWEAISPFSNIVKMIDLMTFFVKMLLVAVVMISILNVMIMAVYERMREIGTAAAIGTSPLKINLMFITEGLLLGIFGAVVGSAASVIAVAAINASELTFSFGRNENMLLTASVDYTQLITISVTVIIVAVIASIQPAFKASRMDPIKALRHV